MTTALESIGERYHLRAAAAYVTARLGLDALRAEESATRVAQGIEAGLDLHRFKRGRLARVERVLGTLRGLEPRSLLDLGPGRGAFLFPLLETLPGLRRLAAVEPDPLRLELYQELRRGGLEELHPLRADALELPLAGQSFDAVTALEVLEHLAEAWRAAREAVRVARRFVLASVPSHPDDNPGHLRFFSGPELEALFLEAGARRVQLEHVLGHRILIAHTGGRQP